MLERPISGLHEAAYLLAAFSFASQLLAIVRDRLLAHTFGAGPMLDVYYASFRIPDLVYVTAGSLISISVLVPLFSDRISKGNAETRRAVDAVFTWFSLLVVTTAGVAFVVAPYVLPKLFSGFSSEMLRETLSLTRLLLLSPILLGVSNFLAGITQSFRRYAPYALSPVLYNLGIIAGIQFLYPLWGIEGVAWGVIIGAFLHMLVELPTVGKLGLLPRLVRSRWSEIKPIFVLSLPRTLALSMSQFSSLALLSFASLIGAGSIAVFSLAWNLQSVPLSLIGVSYALAAFPALSALYAKGDIPGFAAKVSAALRHIIFWTVPAAVLFIVLRAQIVRTVFGSGDFGWDDTRLTAAALAMFAISIPAQSIATLLIRAFYATGDTKVSLVSALIEGASSIGFGLLFLAVFNHFEILRYFFESLLRIEGLSGSAVVALPAAFAAGSLLQATRLWILMRRRHKPELVAALRAFGQVFSASIIMGFVAYLSLNALSPVFGLETLVGVFMQGLVSGLIGLVAYFVVLKLMKSPELRDIALSWRRRVPQPAVIAPEQPEL